MLRYFSSSKYVVTFLVLQMLLTSFFSAPRVATAAAGDMTVFRSTGYGPQDMWADGKKFWTANSVPDGTETKLPANNVSLVTSAGVISTYRQQTGLSPVGVVSDGVNVWTVNQADNSVTKTSQTGGTIGVLTTYAGTGESPVAIVFDGTYIWTANQGAYSVTRIALNGTMTTFTGTGGKPESITFDGTYIWTANGFESNSVTRIAQDGTMTTFTGTGDQPHDITFLSPYVWTANYKDKSVTRVASDGSMVTYPIGRTPGFIESDGTDLWVGNRMPGNDSDGNITQILFDGSNVTTHNWNVGINPTSLAFLAGEVWFVNDSNLNQVFKFAPGPLSVVTTYIGTGDGPQSITFDGTSFWTANFKGRSVTKVSPMGTMLTYGLDSSPHGISYLDGDIWTANKNSITRISGSGNRMMTYWNGLNNHSIASDGSNYLWATNDLNDSVTRIDNRGDMITYPGAGSTPSQITYDGVNMWAVNPPINSVTRIAPDGTMTVFPGTGNSPRDIVFDGTYLWTANYAGNSVTRIAQDGTMTSFTGTGNGPIAITFDGTYVWTANFTGNNVTRISNDGTMTTYSIPVPGPTTIVYDGSYVWTGHYADRSVTRIEAEESGTVSVSTNLPSASWSVSGPHDDRVGAGTSKTYLDSSTGVYTISFDDVPGYVTPADESLTLTVGGTINFVGNYGQYNLTSSVAPAVSSGITVLNQDVSFVATVKNTGSADAVKNFKDQFMYCWGASCVPNVLIGSQIANSALSASQQRSDVSEPLNLTQTGSLTIEHCVDANDDLPFELDEVTKTLPSDNCSQQTFLVTPTANSLMVNNCIIADEANKCSSNFANWDLTGVADPYIENTTSGIVVSTSTQPVGYARPGPSITLVRGSAYSNANTGYNIVVGRDGGTVLASRTPRASCLPDSFFHTALDVCKPRFAVDLLQTTFASLIVRSNTKAKLDVKFTNTDYEVSCIINVGVPPGTTITHTGLIPTNTYSITTLPLTAAQVVRIECSVPSVPGTTKTQDVDIYVVPNVIET